MFVGLGFRILACPRRGACVDVFHHVSQQSPGEPGHSHWEQRKSDFRVSGLGLGFRGVFEFGGVSRVFGANWH